ncbi:uncharacterized protein LOC111054605 isoform X2 [Nilaparvata lugens]|uniref:uncharacterized protein LOC111054605 isoform X2 n=1 Tax=Nilaparvata lugens TaxID=108931 RepID=UPI00193D1121|nr:uncharacterized protein LOC111054605 isoform X2 [Nilaparvata lugens]
MTSGKYFVCLLLMLLAAPECFAKHRKHTDKPLNENQPTMFATSPPLEMPMYEEDSGPALIAADPMASK